MNNDADTLDLPPFPPMKWEEYNWWDGTITLGSTHYAGLTITPFDPEKSRIPSEIQEKAFVHLIQHWEQIFAAVLNALMPHYQRLRPRYTEFLQADADRLMPSVTNAEKLSPLIDLRQVHIHPWSKDGIGYVGLQFGCTWDQEHGLGVMLHQQRIVDIGGADVSFAWAPDEADNP